MPPSSDSPRGQVWLLYWTSLPSICTILKMCRPLLCTLVGCSGKAPCPVINSLKCEQGFIHFESMNTVINKVQEINESINSAWKTASFFPEGSLVLEALEPLVNIVFSYLKFWRSCRQERQTLTRIILNNRGLSAVCLSHISHCSPHFKREHYVSHPRRTDNKTGNSRSIPFWI